MLCLRDQAQPVVLAGGCAVEYLASDSLIGARASFLGATAPRLPQLRTYTSLSPHPVTRIRSEPSVSDLTLFTGHWWRRAKSWVGALG
ncbi:MAG TPA: hypothetical protein VJV79_08890 [Polyangiaceae bacterium]|nr:hypothetical protein [Polyangiaceae bacterium]